MLSSVILAVIIAFDVTPWVRGGFGWRWTYLPVEPSIIPFALLIAGYCALGGWLLHRRARAGVVLAVAFIAAALIPVMAASLRGDALYVLFGRIFSEVASYHMVGAASVDWGGGEWRDWPGVMARIGSHVATSPPGLLLSYGFAADLADKTGLALPLSRPLIAAVCADYKLYDLTLAEVASGWFGVLYPLWAAFAVFPLYALTRRIGASRAAVAALLWPLVPGLSGFATSNSTLFPLFALLMMLPLIGRTTTWRAVLSGVVLGVATFTNFALLPLAGLAGYFVLSRWVISVPRPSFSQPLRLGIAFGIGALMPWLVWLVLTGDTPLDLLRQSFEYHLDLDRPYAFWVWFHVWDWALWGGLAVFVVAILTARQRWRERASAPDAAALTIALALTVLTLTVSGITRGESGRIWLFLAPFVLVIASATGGWRWRDIALAQGVLTLALVFAIDAFNAPDVPPFVSLPAALTDSAPIAVFSDGQTPTFSVLGYQAEIMDNTLRLSLTVVGHTPPTAPLWFGMIPVASDGTITPSQPIQPVDAKTGQRQPATCWTAARRAEVVLIQTLDAPLTGAGYYISLSAYGYRANDAALSVDSTQGTTAQLGLGPFTLATP